LVVNATGKAVGIVYRSENYYSHYDYEYEDPYNDRPLFQIIPAEQFKSLIMNPPELITQKEGGGKNWLGIQMQILTKEMAKYWDLGDIYGIIINKVIPGSPAEKADLKSGDILISFDKLQFEGYDKKNADILRNYVRNIPEGNISAQILRDKKRKTIKIKLESAPKSRFLAEEYSDEILGIGVKELTQDFIINNDLDFDTEGVWVSRVEDAGAASLGGIDINDLVIQINDHEVKNLEDFEEFTKDLQNSKSEYIQVFLKRQGRTRFVFIKLIKDEDKKM
jgi:serine protease Do